MQRVRSVSHVNQLVVALFDPQGDVAASLSLLGGQFMNPAQTRAICVAIRRNASGDE